MFYDFIAVEKSGALLLHTPFGELLLSFAVAFILVAIVVWDHQAAIKAELETQMPRQPGT